MGNKGMKKQFDEFKKNLSANADFLEQFESANPAMVAAVREMSALTMEEAEAMADKANAFEVMFNSGGLTTLCKLAILGNILRSDESGALLEGVAVFINSELERKNAKYDA